MSSNNAELVRLVVDATELRHQVAVVAGEIDYVERTGAVPDRRMRAWAERLLRVADGHDEHCRGLTQLVDD